VWQGYVTHLVTTLRGRGHRAQALTTRGTGDEAGTVLAGELGGHEFQLRVLRVGGSVSTIDIRFGRDLVAEAPPTFTVVTRPGGRFAEAHVEPPPPELPAVIRIGEAGFDARFRCRGDGEVLRTVLDDALRERLFATLEGWLAVWDGRSVRHRVHPGRGASLDQPVPIADLASRGHVAAAGERLVATLEVLAVIAARTLPPADTAAPAPAEFGEEPR